MLCFFSRNEIHEIKNIFLYSWILITVKFRTQGRRWCKYMLKKSRSTHAMEPRSNYLFITIRLRNLLNWRFKSIRFRRTFFGWKSITMCNNLRNTLVCGKTITLFFYSKWRHKWPCYLMFQKPQKWEITVTHLLKITPYNIND